MDFSEIRKNYEDPIKSHDGMDINPFSGVVESSGYGYQQDVTQDSLQASRQAAENQKLVNQMSKNDWER